MVAVNLLTLTASELQEKLTASSITSRQLVKLYVSQIDQYNGYLKAVIAITPSDLLEKAAAQLDDERARGNIRGPLHGIPILIKDNIATVPNLGLPTTCGSLALVGSKPRENAIIVEKLIAAGAIILGKANLSEWAWFRSDWADSGWSAVGGQTQSPYVRGGFTNKHDSCNGHSNPGGSSSGSAVSVAAGFAPISIGTETSGSLVVPSDRASLYTIRPTIDIVPQAGIIPVSPYTDSAGPMAKSALDIANLMDLLVDPSKTTIPVGGYKSAVTGTWGDIRIGVLDPEKWVLNTQLVKHEKQASDQMFREWKAAYEKLGDLVKVVKPVELLSIDETTDPRKVDMGTVFDAPFQKALEEYLASTGDSRIRTLQDLIEFNKEHAEQELPPSADNQNGLIGASNNKQSEEEYRTMFNSARELCSKDGIEKALDENNVDIIMGPGDGPMFSISAIAGCPTATLPLGYLDFNGRAFGLQIITRAHREDLLIQAQSAWEATFPKRQPPALDEIVNSMAN